MRSCGECSECCRLHDVKIDEEDYVYYTPQGHWCKYCTQPGCGIWGTVKQMRCREFNCGWLQNENIPDNLKPNLSGIVLEVLDNNPNTSKFWIDEKNFDNTNVLSKKLEQYTQRVYTNIYNGE